MVLTSHPRAVVRARMLGKRGQEMGVASLASGRGWYRRSGLVWLVGGLLVLGLMSPGVASAASDITFVAPAGALAYPDQTPEGPVGYTEAPDAFRTTQVQPVIGIEADAGAQLQCHANSVFVTQPCGPRPARLHRRGVRQLSAGLAAGG